MCHHVLVILSSCVRGQTVGGRTIAVDWAVSKAQFQSASAAETPGRILITFKNASLSGLKLFGSCHQQSGS